MTFSPCIEQIQVANCSCPLLYGQSQCPPLMLTRVSLAENRSTNAFCWFPRRAHVRNSLAQHGLRALRSHRCRFGRRSQRLDAQAHAPDQTAEGSSAVFDRSGLSFNRVSAAERRAGPYRISAFWHAVLAATSTTTQTMKNAT